MKLKEGEPVHQMVARAFLEGAVKIRDAAGFWDRMHYHFVGPHGIEYQGDILCGGADVVATLCEKVQADFNTQAAAARQTAQAAHAALKVAPLFRKAGYEPECDDG